MSVGAQASPVFLSTGTGAATHLPALQSNPGLQTGPADEQLSPSAASAKHSPHVLSCVLQASEAHCEG
jgi:hypothetical protein